MSLFVPKLVAIDVDECLVRELFGEFGRTDGERGSALQQGRPAARQCGGGLHQEGGCRERWDNMVALQHCTSPAALKQYDGVPLDGKPMTVELASRKMEQSRAPPRPRPRWDLAAR